MGSLAETFSAAWGHHQAGNLTQAEQLYRQILQQEPAYADAWCFLGAVCQAQGKFVEAEANYRRAIQIMPNFRAAQNCLGIILAQHGKLAEAATCFEQLLAADANDADAHNNIGLVRAEQGLWKQAVASYRRALQLRPTFAAARGNLAVALQRAASPQPDLPTTNGAGHSALQWRAYESNLRGAALAKQGLFDEASKCFKQALEFDPANADSHLNLGSLYAHQNQLDEAITEFVEVLSLKPNHPEAHYNLGVVLNSQGKSEEAVACYREAIKIKPDHRDAHNNLAAALMQLRRPGEAVDCLRGFLEYCPADALVCTNLGNALGQSGELEEAARSYRQALDLQPDCVEAYHNLGGVLERQDKMADAVACYDRALELRPRSFETWTSLANARRKQGLFEESLRCCDRALAANPSWPQAHCNRAIVWLLLGHWRQGWTELEWRWQLSCAARYSFQQPLWDGSPLGGKTILLLAEQGLGDTIQFIRYVPLVRERGGRVIVQCQAALLTLLAKVSGIEQLIPWGAPLPHFDAYLPFLSLPGVFHNSIDDLPASVPYLQPNQSLAARWRQAIDPKGLNIGIAWQGSSNYNEDHLRSIPLHHFGRLAQVPGVRLVSLQKGPPEEQIRLRQAQFPVVNFGDELDKEAGAFMDTGAIMTNLDLVISSDTAVPHLAGALGAPVWVALPFVPDWRWLLQRDDSPWYPTMRLYRQKRSGDWGSVFERMAADLQGMIGKKPKNAS